MTVFWQAVYWFSLPVLAVLLLILLRRRLAKEFPLFFGYIVTGILIDLVRLLAYRAPGTIYYYVYWISDYITAVFALLATCELTLKRLFPHFQKIRLYRYLFAFAGAVIAGATTLTAFTNQTEMLQLALLRSLHTIDFFRVIMLMFLVGLMLLMGKHWSRYEFGIALGLGVNASAFLASFAVWSRFFRTLRDYLPPFAYDAACLIWLITFWRPEKSRSISSVPVSPEVLHQVRQLEETLKDSLIRKKPTA